MGWFPPLIFGIGRVPARAGRQAGRGREGVFIVINRYGVALFLSPYFP